MRLVRFTMPCTPEMRKQTILLGGGGMRVTEGSGKNIFREQMEKNHTSFPPIFLPNNILALLPPFSSLQSFYDRPRFLVVCRYVERNPLRANLVRRALYQSLQALSRHRHNLVKQRSRLMVQMRRLLHQTMPGFADLFEDDKLFRP
jgi:hypothetical protein